nr:glycosyl hydrolase 53 family protein [uncultured Carboxylicivirga sp.]
MKITKFLYLIVFVLFVYACGSDDDTPVKPIDPEVPEDMSGFAKGADVSWLTEMESNNIAFRDTAGEEKECISLLKSMGMNSIRLRVWVDPVNGWCNKADLLVKAKRAADLNMRILIDFHYSDVWADPATQTKPVAWENYNFDELCQAVADHTTDVLTSLKEWGITPEWVQVGNETGDGMLWEDGRATVNMANYATLNNFGYDAVKAVFPEAIVIIHRQEGDKNGSFRWLFDNLKANGAKWDAIGMSLYPEQDNLGTINDLAIANVKDMIERYDCDVVFCEVGYYAALEDASYTFLHDLITRSKAIDRCLGVFYWEPQSYNNWKGYDKGAFDADGMPTKALFAFDED